MKVAGFFLLVVLNSTVFSQSSNDLARVAILSFINEEQNKSYSWVEASLPGAIGDSMQKQFEYQPVPPGQLEEALEKIKKNFSEGYSSTEIALIATRLSADIVIYGSFQFDQKSRQLAITAQVYDASAKKEIGKITELSPVANKLFSNIKMVSQKIVQVIYKYTLGNSVSEQQLRLLVLVPSFQTGIEKQLAVEELKTLKNNLAEKHSGRFITLDEFYRERNISRGEQRRVNMFAKKRDQPKIIEWLRSHDVNDSFVVFVNNQKIEITPVVSGKTQQVVSYRAGATKEEKKKAHQQLAEKAAIGTRVTLTKSDSWYSNLISGELYYSGFAGMQLTAGESNRIFNHGPALKASASSSMFFSWLQPVVIAGLSLNTGQENAFSKYMVSYYFHGGLGYYWRIPWFSFEFALQPFIVGGLSGGYIKNFESQVFLTTSVELGLMFHYFFRKNLAVSFSSSTVFYNDHSKPLLFDLLYAGITMRR